MKTYKIFMQDINEIFGYLWFVVKGFVFMLLVFYTYLNHQSIMLLDAQIEHLSPRVVEIPENQSPLILEPLETQK